MEQATAAIENFQSKPAPLAWREEKAGEEENMGTTVCQTAGTKEDAHKTLIGELEAQIRKIEATTGSDNQALITQLATLAKPILDWDCRLQAKFQYSKCENAHKLGIIVNKLYPAVNQVFKWGRG